MTCPSSRKVRSRAMICSSVVTSTPVKGSSSRMILTLLRQRAGQEDALLLAARQFADLAVAQVGQAHRVSA
jgi:hypothetical protein